MKRDPIIARFSFYGFLKNLRFFEPFFLLFLREKGLSFLEIGFLFSFREILINLIEIPSGAVADLFGRKTAMIISFSSYVISFSLFGVSTQIHLLFAAMFFFSIGEAFRTGTHKAIIFDYLKHQNMLDKKKEIYGYTRSWSQIGSAISALAASLFVFIFKSYEYVFWLSIIPYLLGIINILSYPSYLNIGSAKKISIPNIFSHLLAATKNTFKNKQIRNLIWESIGINGQFKSVKEYLQPMIQLQALTLPLFFDLQDKQRTAILIGAIYFALYFFCSYCSKNAFRFASLFKNDSHAVRALVIISLPLFILAGLGSYFNFYIFPIIGFVLLYAIQNIWRPIQVARFADSAPEKQQATILSIESQAKTAGVFILAPIIGYSVDTWGHYSIFVTCFLVSMFILLKSD